MDLKDILAQVASSEQRQRMEDLIAKRAQVTACPHFDEEQRDTMLKWAQAFLMLDNMPEVLAKVQHPLLNMLMDLSKESIFNALMTSAREVLISWTKDFTPEQRKDIFLPVMCAIGPSSFTVQDWEDPQYRDKMLEPDSVFYPVFVGPASKLN